jgi:2-polyprenyl-3-methyl-5-hydroxy-6-metoxy-1,4-benzoquinol methylase
MPDQIKSCPICTFGIHRHFEDYDSNGELLHYRICMRCGAVFQSPCMDEEELNAFYQEGYRTLYQKSEQPTKKDLVMQEERAVRTLAMIQKDVKDVRRHLDIGSSSGSLLDEIRNAYGCQSVGIEPGDAYRDFSKQRDLEVYASLNELPKQGKPFDLVSMMHVLEHFPNPVEALHDLLETHMIPGGYLLVEVPNLIEHAALEVAHPIAFTAATLREAVHQSGFEVLWTKTHGSFRSPVLNLYITLLAKSSRTPIRSAPIRSKPRGVATRRRLGKLKRDLFTRYFPDWTWQSPSILWEDND